MATQIGAKPRKGGGASKKRLSQRTRILDRAPLLGTKQSRGTVVLRRKEDLHLKFSWGLQRETEG